MPNYKPGLALLQLANTYSCQDKTPVVFQYGGFWGTFYQPPQENSIRCLFRALFSNMGLRKKVTIISVFGGVADLKSLPRNDDSIFVQFSGEMFNVNADWFDLNLIMAPEEEAATIVPLINFATNAHEFNLWPLLKNHRPYYPLACKKFCTFVVRNGGSQTRNIFMRKLSRQYKQVDCCGPFENNVGHLAPEDETEYGDRYYPYLQQYKFMICFENTKKKNYVTEKLLNAYAAGTIPIYWGTPDVLNWFNPKAFLYLEDETEEAMDRLIERIKEIDQKEELYQSIFNEPLLKEIPEVFKIENLREKIKNVLMKKRPDAF